MVNFAPLLFASRRVSFFCLTRVRESYVGQVSAVIQRPWRQKKRKKALPHIKDCGFPQLLNKMGGCGLALTSHKTGLVAELRQSSPSPNFICALRLSIRALVYYVNFEKLRSHVHVQFCPMPL